MTNGRQEGDIKGSAAVKIELVLCFPEIRAFPADSQTVTSSIQLCKTAEDNTAQCPSRKASSAIPMNCINSNTVSVYIQVNWKQSIEATRFEHLGRLQSKKSIAEHRGSAAG